jgi:hypothetical protein
MDEEKRRREGPDAAIRPDASGRLDIGAWQAYGLTAVPELGDRAERILAALGAAGSCRELIDGQRESRLCRGDALSRDGR